MGPLRIVLVDDHEMVLQGLSTILGRFLGRVRVIGQALDADAALKLADHPGPAEEPAQDGGQPLQHHLVVVDEHDAQRAHGRQDTFGLTAA